MLAQVSGMSGDKDGLLIMFRDDSELSLSNFGHNLVTLQVHKIDSWCTLQYCLLTKVKSPKQSKR